MKYKLPIIIILSIITSSISVYAQDSVDVIQYDIRLDMGNKKPNRFSGLTHVYIHLLKPNMTQFSLDLQGVTVDSMHINGILTDSIVYNHRHLQIPLPAHIQSTDTLCITVFYNGGHSTESGGWGGIHFGENLIYNLGVAFNETPHSYGRTWFPCRDNFTDKALFDFSITTSPDQIALCNGLPESEILNNDGSKTYSWKQTKPMPTYLASVAVGTFNTLRYSIQGLTFPIPVLLAFSTQDSMHVSQAFSLLEDIIPKYESCFGPYEWDRIGYVATPLGSMEHTSNIALVSSCMDNTDNYCQSVIAHEVAHSWFGNLITCASAYDMWFNEGGASFCEEIAMEAVFGKNYSNNYYQQLLNSVLRTLHYTDNGYLSIYGLPANKTYSSTVYKKGAVVFHSLRGYVGDDVFYASIRKLMERNKYASFDSYQIRDSLSLYSGIDLTNFFNFHVFGNGFLHYSIDSMKVDGLNTTVYMRQRLLGAQHFANGNRVPITFFSNSRDTITRTMVFDSALGVQTFTLPFTPKFGIIDYANSFSDAVTADETDIVTTHVKSLKNSYFSVQSTRLGDPAWLYVAHHWICPENIQTTHPAVKRMARNRYWKIDGFIPDNTILKGKFWYARHQAEGDYTYLDKGFLDRSASIDSLIVLYRPDISTDWAPVYATKEGNNNQGYMVVNNLKQGEYVLAIGEKSLIGLEKKERINPQIKVIPNPSKSQFRVQLPAHIHTATIILANMNGIEVFRKENVPHLELLSCPLPSGTYLLQVINGNQLIHTQKIIFD